MLEVYRFAAAIIVSRKKCPMFRLKSAVAALSGMAVVLCPVSTSGQGGSAASAQTAAPGKWSATGTLLEACTCAVPCTCNFGEAPSPHSYCHAVFGYRVDKGSYEGVDLSGLVFGGADGPAGATGFLDERASAVQRPALEKLARRVFAQGGPSGGARRFAPVRIVHEVKGNDLRLDFAGRGGFRARVIIGRDGKTPVVVENNTVWPIRRAIKGKALPLAFQHESTGKINGDGSNANYGAFSFEGRTQEQAVSGAAPVKQVAASTHPASCCSGKR